MEGRERAGGIENETHLDGLRPLRHFQAEIDRQAQCGRPPNRLPMVRGSNEGGGRRSRDEGVSRGQGARSREGSRRRRPRSRRGESGSTLAVCERLQRRGSAKRDSQHLPYARYDELPDHEVEVVESCHRLSEYRQRLSLLLQVLAELSHARVLDNTRTGSRSVSLSSS